VVKRWAQYIIHDELLLRHSFRLTSKFDVTTFIMRADIYKYVNRMRSEVISGHNN
jgi:hypothetical protein